MFTLNCRGRLLIVDKPVVMGIINVTPDSMYSSSRFESIDSVLRQAEKMLTEGATILDVGGQSTRPGSKQITAEEEIQRTIAPIEALCKSFPETFISIDTYYSKVAGLAVAAGASIVNDISAGTMDEYMVTTVASMQVPFVCMHMQGTPQTMQQRPHYENVTKEVLDFFINKLDILRQADIKDVIIDPGFGFGKTIEHNFELLRNLPIFKILNAPILLGISRKSTIYKTLEITTDEALNGTTVLNTIGLLNGACILRVHDVKEASETIKLFQSYKTD